MTDFKSMTYEELKDWMVEHSEPAYRAGQVYQWMHEKLVRSFDEMGNVSKNIKAKMSAEGELSVLEKMDVQISADGTRKYLFAAGRSTGENGQKDLIESVLMRYSYGNSVCISSQVGCRMGCKFCASTLDGLIRNLTPAEMLDQIYMISKDIGERISHVVVMGTGEPMDNFDNIVRFITLLTSEKGLNISRRNITVSTCGIVPRIKDLADANLGITLALSLHAPTDEKRKSIMPIANKYSIEQLMDAVGYYYEKTGRRVTFEYAMSQGINDTDDDVNKLAALAERAHAHINLIPVNPVTERGYAPTPKNRVGVFKNKLENKGINVTIRRELGQDIDGACGQLRHRHMEEIQ